MHSLHSSWEEHMLQLSENKGLNEMGHGGEHTGKNPWFTKPDN